MQTDTTTQDDAIRAVVTRLSRPHASGGAVIERAAILAEAGAPAILTWIAAHAGEPEQAAAAGGGRGLHSPRFESGTAAVRQAPLRYVLPPGALLT